MNKIKLKLRPKSFLQLLVLAAGAETIYYVIYMRGSFYDSFLNIFGFTNEQFGTLSSTYALVGMCTYFVGGVVSDKISTKKLLAASFAATGVLNLWYSTIPKSYALSVIIFILFGITTTLTFWASLFKATRQFGQEIGGEKVAMGSLEGIRSFVGMLTGTLTVLFFSMFATEVAGITATMRAYGVFMIAIGIITFFVFEEGTGENLNPENPFRLALSCLKIPEVWVMGFIVFGLYGMSSCIFPYVSRISTTLFGASVVAAAYFSLFDRYFKPFGAFLGGFIGEKISATKMLICAAFFYGLCFVGFLLLPAKSNMLVPFLVIYAVLMVFNGAARGMYYAPLSDANIPMNLSGSAIGVIATVGYLPEAIYSPIIGGFLDRYEPVKAFRLSYTMGIASGLFAILMCIVLLYMIKKRKEKSSQTEQNEKGGLGNESIR